MSRIHPEVDVTSDAELIAAVRGGDLEAYGVLFERHVDAARRLGRQLTTAADADDLVSDAFAKVLRVLQDGGGPDLAFRAYLLTAVRRLHVDRIRAESRLRHTDDMEPFDPGVPFRDTAVEGFENAAAAKAFASLPERWQMVLWHTEVEGQKPAEVAELLGMSANSVSALAYRAREGLRQAFLNSHAQEIEDERCRWTNDHLGGYVRKALSRRDTAKVEAHLDECRRCMAIYLELSEVNSGLGALLAPLLLGTAGATYLAATGGTAAKAGVMVLLGRVRDTVVANTQVAAVSGAAAIVTAAGVTAVVVADGDEATRPAAGSEVARTTAPDATPTDVPTRRPEPRPRRRSTAPSPVVAPEPTQEPSATQPPPAPGPSEPVSTEPAPAPTPEPPSSPEPSEEPTTEPSEEPTADGPEPTPDPEPEPTPQPSRSDLVLAVTLQQRLLSASVLIDVSGIPAEGSAELRLSWTGVVLNQLPAGCQRSGPRSAVCHFDGDDRRTWRGIRLSRGSVEMSLAAVGFTDTDPGNNTWQWPGR